MISSRRNFLKTSAIAATAAALLPDTLFAAPKIQRVGLQLYSVRDHMMKDPAGTLKKLADMGYVYVEHANYIDRKFYGYNATEFKKTVRWFRPQNAKRAHRYDHCRLGCRQR